MCSILVKLVLNCFIITSQWNFTMPKEEIGIETRPVSIPDSKVHGANMGPTWVLSAPDGPHVGPTNLAIRDPPSVCTRCTWFWSRLDGVYHVMNDVVDVCWYVPSRRLVASYHKTSALSIYLALACLENPVLNGPQSHERRMVKDSKHTSGTASEGCLTNIARQARGGKQETKWTQFSSRWII